MRRVRVLSMGALAVLAIVAVGCGDNDNNGSESGGGGKVTGVQAGTGSRQDKAAEAGKKAAEAAGGNVDLPKKRPACCRSSVRSNRRSGARTP